MNTKELMKRKNFVKGVGKKKKNPVKKIKKNPCKKNYYAYNL